MLSVKSQHNTVLSQHNIVYLYFPTKSHKVLRHKMKYDSYERMTMLSTDFHYLVVFTFHDPTNIFML